MSKEVPAHTYGEEWIIKDKFTQEQIVKIGNNDDRSLSEAGIMGGVPYIVEIL